MSNTTQIKSMDDNDNFHRALTVYGCLRGCARWKHSVVCKQLHLSSTMYLNFKERKICAFFLPNCTSLLQNLDLGITKYFQQLYRKQVVQKTACMLDSGKDVTTKIKCSASNTCHSCALATYEPNTEDYVDSRTEDDEAFHYD